MLLCRKRFSAFDVAAHLPENQFELVYQAIKFSVNLQDCDTNSNLLISSVRADVLMSQNNNIKGEFILLFKRNASIVGKF